MSSSTATGRDKVHLNDGMGNFGTGTVIPTAYAGSTYAVALGDMDEDGDLDIVTGKYATYTDVLYTIDGRAIHHSYSTSCTSVTRPFSKDR